MRVSIFIYIVFSISLLVSCSSESDKLENRLDDYAKKKRCGTEPCIFKMSEITWFSWDTMQLLEDEKGVSCNFIKNGKLIYSYLKPTSFDGPRDIEFGYANLSLQEFYTFNDCTFKLKVERRDNLFKSKVYFILPVTPN
jgi:hypothetical protein